ncbi:hypothetical protein GW916_12395 [bacterium]|nr:hypothetical protein [bacterium]
MKKWIPLATLFTGTLVLTAFNGRPPATQREFTPSSRNGAGARRFSVTTGQCKSVKVDCRTHRIYIEGAQLSKRDSVIDCGANGKTINGTGTIGGLHRGRAVKDGVRIEGILGMGDSGGGKVFHTPWWNPGQMPKGVDGSKGCVRTSPNVLRILKTCKGASLTITGGTTRSRRGNLPRKQQAPARR